MSEPKPSDGLWIIEDGELTPVHTAADGEKPERLLEYFAEWADFRDDVVRLSDDLEGDGSYVTTETCPFCGAVPSHSLANHLRQGCGGE